MQGNIVISDVKLLLEISTQMRVLYVEDNQDVREATLILLNNYFKSVDVAVDGVDGLEKFNTFFELNNTHHDIVITDINMPNMSGIELIEAIRMIDKEQPIMVISAHNDTHYLLQLIRFGIKNFLLKPLDLDQMIEQFYEVCRGINDQRLMKNYLKNLEELNKTLMARIDFAHSNGHSSDSDMYRPNDLIALSLDHRTDIDKFLSAVNYSMMGILVDNSLKKITANINRLSSAIGDFSVILGKYTTLQELSVSFINLSFVLEEYTVKVDATTQRYLFLQLESFVIMLIDNYEKLLKKEFDFETMESTLNAEAKRIGNIWIKAYEG
jgi:YesN/AraC family two-component response regulator